MTRAIVVVVCAAALAACGGASSAVMVASDAVEEKCMAIEAGPKRDACLSCVIATSNALVCEIDGHDSESCQTVLAGPR